MGAAVYIEIPDLDQFVAKMRSAPQVVERELNQATRKAEILVQREARVEAPVKKGGLRQSIQVFPLPLGSRIGPRIKYAEAVHGGTRPRTITAKGAGALYWPGAAHPVKSVKHPGSKANPFMDRALSKSEDGVRRFFQQAADIIVREAS